MGFEWPTSKFVYPLKMDSKRIYFQQEVDSGKGPTPGEEQKKNLACVAFAQSMENILKSYEKGQLVRSLQIKLLQTFWADRILIFRICMF